jgi:hypothetical protein
MKPLFFTLKSHRHLMAIPDTEAHLNGHPVISYTYSLFIDRAKGDVKQSFSKEDILHMDKITDPDYLGFVAFEQPANVFSYTAGEHTLSVTEVEEVIEYLTFIRGNPDLWNPLGNL